MSGSDEPTDELAQRARHSAGSFAALYERVAPALYAWASLRIRQPLARHHSPEDLMHETWLRAASRFDQFDPERGPFRAWIFTIATRLLLGMARNRHVGGGGSAPNMTSIPDQATRVSERAARDERLSAFVAFVQALPADDRILVVSCGLEGASPAAVAPRLDLTPAAAHKRWQRLRVRLRDELRADDLLVS